jgi:hypothetical protein
MRQIQTLHFEEPEHNDTAYVFVRAGAGCIGIGFSLQHNGDLEVFFPIEKCRELIGLLQSACATVCEPIQNGRIQNCDLTQLGIIQFLDMASREAASAALRVEGDFVGIKLSLESDGDLELFFPAGECQDLSRALQEALSVVSE